MIVAFFLVAGAVIVLIAAPWKAPAHMLRISHTFLFVLAALIQVPVLLTGSPFFGPLLGTIFIALWALFNRHLPGVWLLLTGVVANGIAMASHGGAMPLHPDAAQSLGLMAHPHDVLLAGSKDVIGQGSLLIWLGDWIIVNLPGMQLVSSPGDIAIFAGLLHWAGACRVGGRARLPGNDARMFGLDSQTQRAG